MSLQYIIDGYNITNHPLFKERINKKIKDHKLALLELIKREKLSGSPRNKITVVFDGYLDTRDNPTSGGTECCVVFSRKETADERIKKMVENSGNPKNTVVVSDDKEIRFFARAYAVRCSSVEEFIKCKVMPQRKEISPDAELSYSQMHAINQELKKLWLE